MRDGVTDFGITTRAAVEMPADNDLRRGFTVFIRQLTNNFLIEYPFAALRKRAPGLGLDLMRRIPGVKLALLHQRVKFNLVYHRSDAGFTMIFADDERKLQTRCFLPAPPL